MPKKIQSINNIIYNRSYYKINTDIKPANRGNILGLIFDELRAFNFDDLIIDSQRLRNSISKTITMNSLDNT
jgi:hypothetical protein